VNRNEGSFDYQPRQGRYAGRGCRAGVLPNNTSQQRAAPQGYPAKSIACGGHDSPTSMLTPCWSIRGQYARENAEVKGKNAELFPQVAQPQMVTRSTWGQHRDSSRVPPGYRRLERGARGRRELEGSAWNVGCRRQRHPHKRFKIRRLRDPRAGTAAVLPGQDGGR